MNERTIKVMARVEDTVINPRTWKDHDEEGKIALDAIRYVEVEVPIFEDDELEI